MSTIYAPTVSTTTVTPPATARDVAVLAAITTTVLAWASAFVVIRWAGESFSPGALALGRLALGSAALGALLLARRRWVAPNRREWVLLGVCGVAWFAVYNVALNAAEQHLDAGTTAMLVNIGPILIALLAGVMLGEGFPRWLLVGAAVAFAGTVLIGSAASRSGDVDLLGVVLAVLAAVTYAVGVLAQKPVLRRLPALQVTWLACAVGTLGCLPRRHHLPRAAAHHPDRLAAAGRDAGRHRPGRWCDLPRRGRFVTSPSAGRGCRGSRLTCRPSRSPRSPGCWPTAAARRCAWRSWTAAPGRSASWPDMPASARRR